MWSPIVWSRDLRDFLCAPRGSPPWPCGGNSTLLETAFDAVIMVAYVRSLCESAQRLAPRLAVVALALARGDVHGMTGRLRRCCPELKVSPPADDDPVVVRLAMEAGADGMVAKSRIASDLLTAVDAVLREEQHFPAWSFNSAARRV